MDKKPLVSVLMTVYNREKYIAEAIESILASTYPDWELIIVDDQSTDNSVKIAKSYAQKDKRISLYINTENLGDYPNRNRAASYAKGEYLKYVDADDMIYPFGLEQLVFYMEKFPQAGYGLCTLPPDKEQIFPFELSCHDAYYRHYFKYALFHKAPLSSIIRKKAFYEIGQFSGKRMLGDYEMWHLLSQKYPVVLMPEGITWYRKHEEQEMSSYRTDPMHPFQYLLLSREMLNSQSCPLTSDERRLALKKVDRKISRAVISAFKHHPMKKGFALKAKSDLKTEQIIFSGIKEYLSSRKKYS